MRHPPRQSKRSSSISTVIGVDGCPGGWVCHQQELGSDTIQTAIVVEASDLLSLKPSPSIIAIDIPIGLAARTGRSCDAEARRLLKRRACCVFTPPPRIALNAIDRATASRISLADGGGGVGCHTWGIVGKIRQVDQLLQARPELAAVVVEVHPELSFREWNGGKTVLEPKKNEAGRRSRQRLISRHFGRRAFAKARAQVRRSDAADDDIADAFAALWTGLRIATGQARRIPQVDELDQCGLPMRIWI